MVAVAKHKQIDPGFGRRLRALRDAAGLTQAELGERVGMLQNAVARLEVARREPGWGTVLRLAKALGVSPNDFVDDSPAAALSALADDPDDASADPSDPSASAASPPFPLPSRITGKRK